MVIIFFAGHGATERDAMSTDGDGLEKYLLPWETDPTDLYSTAMPMKDELQHGVFSYYLLEGLRGTADADRDGTR